MSIKIKSNADIYEKEDCIFRYSILISDPTCFLQKEEINKSLFESSHEKTNNLHRQNTKAQISAVTAKLISAFVFRYTDSTIPLFLKSKISSF